jgi:di/tricarboxylate transporter
MRWEEILIVGTALSLASALQDSGAVQWVARGLFGLFPAQPPLVLVYLETVLLSVVVRQIFLQPAPPMAIVIPLVIALAKSTGADPLILALLAAGVVGMVQFFPFQSPPAFLCHSLGIFSVRDQLRISPILVLATIAVMLASALLYWPMLHAIGWI